MKTHYYFIFIFFIALVISCGKNGVNEKFDIIVQSEDYSDSTIYLSGERQSVTAIVSPESSNAVCNIASPTSDVWCTCYFEEKNILSISVSDNATDSSRDSYILVSIGDTYKKIRVSQDYIKYLNFYSSENLIDPSAGKYEIPISTNVDNSQIIASLEDGCDWITSTEVRNNTLIITATRNVSTEDSRSTIVTLSADNINAQISIVQIPMNGYPYIISLDGLSFESYPVYEIWDDTHSVKIGELCKEYLYKYSASDDKDIVNEACVVAYPMYEGAVNYSKGLVVNNGGAISWNASISASTAGSDYIASYTKGDKTSLATVIYLPSGATSMRIEPLDPSETGVINAVCRPMILTDERSGSADSQGNTEESNIYPVVKIALQYWITENFRSSRFADGEPIPTGFNNAAWAERLYPVLKPSCSVSGTSSSDTYIDANDPAGVTTRNVYGCLYSYAALVNKEIDVSGSSSASFSKVDKISPAGWSIPTREQMIIMYSYVSQKNYENYTAQTAEVLPKLLLSGTNVTGFSANGSRQRGVTGGYNAVLYYTTIDYSYEGSVHGSYQLRLREGNYSSIYLVAVGSGTYIRLIKSL